MTDQKILLRPYQLEQVQLVSDSFNAGKRKVALQLPTGAGKTEIAIHIAKKYIERNQKIVFVTSSIDLINQTYNRFARYFGRDQISVFRSTDKRINKDALIHIVSVDTYARRSRGLLEGIEFVIVDEAHEAVAPKYMERFFPSFQGLPFLGLSATFQRVGNKAHTFWDEFICVVDGWMLRDLGFLPKIHIKCPDISYNLKGVTLHGSDYNQKQLYERLKKSKIYSDFNKNFRLYGEGKLSVVFCVNIAFAEEIGMRLRSMGVKNVLVYHSKMPLNEVRETMDKFREFARIKEPACLISINKISKGFDIPEIEVGFMLRPTKSVVKFRQIIGRLTRGKKDVLFIDMTENTMNLGHPYDLMDPYKVKLKYTKASTDCNISRCPNCFAVYKVGLRICPYCKTPRPKAKRTGPEEKTGTGLKDYKNSDSIKNKKYYNRNVYLALKFRRSEVWIFNNLYNEKRDKIFNRRNLIESIRSTSKHGEPDIDRPEPSIWK